MKEKLKKSFLKLKVLCGFLLSIALFIAVPAIAAAPTVDSISPTSGPIGGGTSVTITGTNFSQANIATGGTITYTDANGLNSRSSPPYANGYTIHTFTSSGTFTVAANTTVEYLVVAGGGGASSGDTGGAGAGGVRTSTGFAVTPQAYTITVGAGGVGIGGAITVLGNNGQNSVFSTITSTGGGSSRASGGSGGGADYAHFNGQGTGTAGQGNNGGNSNGNTVANYVGGGGGGAGAVGQTAPNANQAGAGGIGISSSISGTATFYGGGGGAGATVQGGVKGLGGTGGGGDGAVTGASGVNGSSGVANTGGGGGGSHQGTGGSGGSGIVIIKYLTPPSVAIGGTAATNVSFISSTSITATTSAHAAGVVNVVVTNGDGTTGTLTGGFTYNPPPTVTSIVPSSVLKTGGNSVTITGTNFVATPSITFGGVAGTSVTFVSSTTITAVTPVQTAGTYNVVVTNPDAQTGTLTNGITFTDPPPTISSVVPPNGPTSGSTNVTISGSNFINGIDSNVKLLLHGDGTGATFSDAETTAKTITAFGNATQSATQSKFGGKSMFFDGTGDYLTVPTSSDFEFGTGDFTIDWWEYRTDGATGRPSISRDSTSSYLPFALGWNGGLGNLTVVMSSNGTSWDIANLTSLGTVSLNQWVHFAVVRSGNNFYAFKNGIQTSTWTSSLGLVANSNPLSVGRYFTTYEFAGYLDEVRISKGIARWTSNFNPPIGPYALPTVTFGGTQATNVAFVNSTSITAITPSHVAGSTDVVVTNYDLQSATSTNAYTYNNPPGSFTISPSSVPNTGGVTVTITGTNFVATPSITFGGVAGTSVTFVSSTTITAVTPVQTAGTYNVVVTNPDAQTGTLTNGITFTNAPPTVTSVSPTSGPESVSTNVTITGTNFIGTSTMFAAKTSYGTGVTPYSVVSGDFNKDGILDMAVANSSTGNVSVLLGTGTGTFNAKVDYPTALGSVSVTTGDFNADTNLDLAVLNINFTSISILLGTGTGTFGTKTDYTVGSGPYEIVNGDFNGDSKLDLAVASFGTNNVSILLGTGTGTFGAKVDYPTGVNPIALTAGDFNGDSKLDIATANFGTNNVSILLGSGTGTFGTKTDYNTGGGPASVIARDLNGDSKLDLAVANYASSSVSILLGTGTGTFGTKNDYTAGTNPRSVNAGDFNKDGILDLAVANNGSANVSILSGSGTGTFGAKVDFTTGTSPYSVVTGDWNGDTKVDLAMTSSDSSSLSVLLNTLSLLVTFGGVSATNVILVSPTSITATTSPHAAGVVNIVVTDSDAQTATLTNGFTYIAAPTVTSVASSSVPVTGGNTVTITGTNFIATPTVTFGGTAGTGVTLVSSTTLTAITPVKAAGTYHVVVTNPDGQVGTLTNGITYTNPAPSISSITPNNASFAGGTSVTITGTNFLSSSVTFGGTAATSVVTVSSTTITATSPAHTAGVVNIVVTNSDAQTATLTNGFTYNAAPTITSISPSSVVSAGGVTVTITGTNFIATSTVAIGGTAATGVTFVSSTTLTAVTPVKAVGNYNVVVTNPDGQTATLTNGITFTNLPPVVSSITPTGGPTGGGTNVTVTGTNFVQGLGTGGTITYTDSNGLNPRASPAYPGGYTVHTFTSSGTFTAAPGLTSVQSLVVAGGGGGGGTATRSGGGGAGGLLYNASLAMTSGSYSVTIGGGGAGGVSGSLGTNGADSVFSSLTAVGGGGGGTSASGAGQNGGSGGGSGATAGTGVAGQGNNGGITGAGTSPNFGDGGGGGAGGAGGSGTSSVGGPGGIGALNSISGTSLYYAGGGGGGARNGAAGVGGNGGGGAGSSGNGVSATANTGGGGGGSATGGGGTTGGNGASGIVIIKYLTPTNTLTIGGVTATNINFVSSTTITATSPAHALGATDVVVTNSDGTTGTLTNGFTYNPPPTVTSLTPSNVLKTGGDTVTITGTNFVATPSLTFGGVAGTSVTFISSTTLTAVTPVQNAGSYNVVVTNPDGQSATLTNGITFTNPPPHITSITPTGGLASGGTSVTITGTDFGGDLGVGGTITYTDSSGINSRAYSPYPGGYTVHTFTSSGTFAATGTTTVEYLVVAGGGGASSGASGGAGAGGVRTGTGYSIIPQVYTVTIGNGGIGIGGAITTLGNNGENSVFGTITSIGGGASRASGGSGGGADYNHFNGQGTGTAGQGNNGGNSNGSGILKFVGGGGGGAGAAGQTAPDNNQAGAGGIGIQSSINGFSTYYGGGGGGSATSQGGARGLGGAGGGGDGAISGSANGAEAGINTGGGGGGSHGAVGGTGGSGIVIIRYLTPASAVTIGGVAATNIVFVSPTSITATTPAHAGGATNVVVTNGDGQTATLTNGFTYNATPTVTSITPSSLLRTGGDTVTITGTNFVATPSLTFGGVAGTSVTFISSTTLTAVTPVQNAGSYNVVVTNPDGQSATLTNGITFTNPSIAVSSITPIIGSMSGGTHVTITGSNFSGNNSIFGAKTSFTTGTNPYAAVVGDFNKDGKSDLVAANNGGGNVSVLLGAGTGTFGTKSDYQTGSGPSSVATGDWNADSNPDLAVVNNSVGNLSILLGSGTGTFAAHVDYQLGTNPYEVITGDFNGDSKLDLAVAGFGTNNVSILLGTGTGTFGAKADYPTGGTPISVSTGDFNADSKLDLAVANFGTNNVSILLGSGTGTFGTKVDYPTGSNPSSVSTGDFNGDTKLDLAVANFASSSVSILLGSGTGTFGTKTDYTAGTNPRSVNTGDFNSDGKLDLAVANYGSGNLSVLLGTGIGTFGTKVDFTTGTFPYSVNTGDWNGDTKVDLAMTSSDTSSLSVLLNSFDPITATFGGVAATNVVVVDSSTLTATTSAHAVGTVDVVIGYSGQTSTLTNGFTYMPDKFIFTNSPLDIGETESGTLTVESTDADGNAVAVPTDVTLTLLTTSSFGFFARDLNEDPSTRWDYNTVVIPAGQSSVTFYYKDNLKGNPTITATPSIAIGGTAATQAEHIKSKFHFILAGITNPIKQGVPSSATMLAVDSNNNPLSEYTGTVHFTSTDSAAILPANFAITPAMLGGYTFVNGVNFLTQGTWCVTVTDISDSDITGSQCGISVVAPNAGVASKIKFITSPQFLPPQGTSTPITIQLQDVDGNPVVKSSTTTVYIFSDSGTAFFSPNGATLFATEPLVLSIPPNASSMNFFYRDSTQGAHIITAGDDATEGADFSLQNDTQTETITAGSAYALSVALSSHSITASSSTSVNVTLRDSAGNTISSAINQPVYLTGSNGALFSNSISGPWSAPFAKTIGVGENSFTVYVSNTVTGSSTITASDTTPANGASGLVDGTDTVFVTGGVPASFIFTTPTFQITAGAVSDVITIQAKDLYGNIAVAASSTPVYLYASQSGGLFSPNANFSPETANITIPVGQSSASFYFKQSLYNNSSVSITASDNASAPDGAAGMADISQTETIVPGAMYQFAIASSSPTATSAGSENQVTVSVKNSFGVTIPFSSQTTMYFRTDSSSSIHEFSLNPAPSWSAMTSAIIPIGTTSLPFYYKDTGSGSTTITMADEPAPGTDTGILNAQLQFNISASASSKLHFTNSSFTIIAGQVSPAMTIRLEDQYGNVALAGAPVVVNLQTTSQTGSFDTSTGGNFTTTQATIPTGESSVVIYYKDLANGTPTITAHSGSLTDATQSETVNWGSPSALALSIASGTVQAGNPAGPLKASLLNAYGVNIPSPSSFTVNLSSTEVTGAFDTSSGGSFNGSVTSIIIPQDSTSTDFYYRDTKTGSVDIAVAGAGVAPAITTLTITSSPATDLVFVPASGQTLELGEKSSIVNIYIHDQFGNIVTPATSTLISLTSTSAQGTFLNTVDQVITDITIPGASTHVGFYYKDLTIGSSTITAAKSGLASATQTETIIYGAPKSIVLSASSTSSTVGSTSAVIVATLQNNSGAVVPAVGSTVISLGSSSGTGRFDTNPSGAFDGSITTITIPDGQSSGSFYYSDTVIGLPLITASKSGLTSGTITLTLTASAPASMVFLNGVRTTAAGAASSVFTLAFLDNFGNIKILSSPITVNLTTSATTTGGFATSTDGPWTASQITIPAGLSAGNFYYRDTLIGTKTITLSSAGFTDVSQNTIVSPAEIDHFIFLTSPQSFKVLEASGPMTVEAIDAFGNISFPAANLTLNLSSNSAQFQFSLSPSTWSNVTSVVLPLNQSTATFYYKDWRVGTSTITVRDAGSLYGAATQQQNIITTSASEFLIATPPQTVVADTPSGLISFSLVDGAGNPSASQTEVIATITADSPTALFTDDYNVNPWVSSKEITFTPGDITKTFYFKDSATGTFTISINAPGFTSDTVSETVIVGVPAKISFIDNVINTPTGVAVPLTLEVETASGLAVAVAAPTVIPLSDNNGGEFSLTNTPWTPVSSLTIDSGTSQKIIYYKSTLPGSHVITANATSVSLGTATHDLEVIPLNVYRLKILSGATEVALNESTSAIVLQTQDQYGNAVSLTTVDTGGAGFANIYLYGQGQFSTTNIGPWTNNPIPLSLGENTLTFYFKSGIPGAQTLTVSDQTSSSTPDTGWLNDTRVITVLGETPTQLAFSNSPVSIVAGAFGGLTIQAQKSDGTPAVLGTPLVVNVSSNWTGGKFTSTNTGSPAPITQVTIPIGASSVNYFGYNTLVGSYTISADSNGLTSASQDFAVTNGLPSKLIFASAPQTVSVGNDSSSIHIVLEDQFGNLSTSTSNISINFASNDSGTFSLNPGAGWQAITSATISAGTSDFYIYYRNGNAAGTYQLSVTDANSGLTTANQNIIVSAGSVDKIILASSAFTIAAGQASPALSIIFQDQFGNIVPLGASKTIYLYSSSSGRVFSASSSFASAITSLALPSGSSGSTFYYRDLVSGAPTITVSDITPLDSPDIGLLNDTQAETIIPGDPYQFVFTDSPSAIVAGNSRAFNLELQNAYGVPVAAEGTLTAHLYSTSAFGRFSLTDDFQPSDFVMQINFNQGESQKTFYYRDTVAGTPVITASDASPLDSPDTGLINAVRSQSVLTSSIYSLNYITAPVALETGEVSGALAVGLRDQFGNTVLAGSPVIIYPYSSSGQGGFATSSNATAFDATQFLIPSGSSSINFYYKDLLAGNPTITLSDAAALDSPDTGILNAVQTENISNGNIFRVAFKTNSQTLEVGQVSQKITFELQNSHNTARPVDADTTIYLTSSSAYGQFAATTLGPWNVASVTISAGTSTGDIYYRQVGGVSSTITASDGTPPNGPIGWIDGTQSVSINDGVPVQITVASAPSEVIARHTSGAIAINIENAAGYPSPSASSVRLYLRSGDSSDEFAGNLSGPWGVSFVDLAAGNTQKIVYFRSSTEGLHTITISDELPAVSGVGLSNTATNITVLEQTMDHFLVTNISDPMVQGTPSTVIIEPLDADGYIFSNYDGNICFSSSDVDATVPDCYTFNSLSDQGIHSFGNGVAFQTPGEKWVQVDSTVGNYSGRQSNITVVSNSAGPIAKIKFVGLLPQPISIPKAEATGPFTIQLYDIDDQAVNAPSGGYSVKIHSSSPTGSLSLAANGSWSGEISTSIPSGLSSINFYYKDTATGSFTISGNDFQNAQDDVAVQNDFFNIVVSGLLLDATTTLESRDSAKFALVENPILFSNDVNTPLSEGSVTFDLTANDDLSGLAVPVDWSFVFKDVHGNIIDERTVDSAGTYHLVEYPIQYNVPIDSGNWSLDVIATSTDGKVGTLHIPVPVSAWRADIQYDVGLVQLGAPIPITVIAFENNGVVESPADFTVTWLDTTSNVISGVPTLTKSEMTESPAGNFHGSMATDGLTAGQQYHMMLSGVDVNGTILAQSAHADIQIANNPALAPKNFAVEKIVTSVLDDPETYDIRLSWSASTSTAVTGYNIYYSQNKFSKLYDDPCTIAQVQNGDRSAGNCETTIDMDVGSDSTSKWVLLDSTSKNTLGSTIFNADNLPGENYFYIVRADNGVTESGLSSMVFLNKHQFSFNTDSNATNYNWFSIPYSPTYFTNSKSGLSKAVITNPSIIVRDIEGGLGPNTNSKISTISLWDSLTQNITSIYRYRSLPFNKWTGTDFAVLPGSGIYIQPSGNQSPFNWTVLGSDKKSAHNFDFNQGGSATNYNWIAMPYSGMYRRASDVVQDIEGSLGAGADTKINAISLWDSTTQNITSIYRYRLSPFNKWSGINFNINPGDGIYIQLSPDSPPFTWTPAILVEPND